jgi:hypothetical protein
MLRRPDAMSRNFVGITLAAVIRRMLDSGYLMGDLGRELGTSRQAGLRSTQAGRAVLGPSPVG